MTDTRIANVRTKIIVELSRLAKRFKESLEDIGFIVSIGKINLKAAMLKVESGNIKISVIIHDEDDIFIRVPKDISISFDIARRASFKSFKEVIGFFRTVSDRINL